MTITRVGTTQKYANGWEQAFGKAKKSKPASNTAVKDKPAGSKKGATAKAPVKAVKKAKITKTAAKPAPKATAKKVTKKK